MTKIQTSWLFNQQVTILRNWNIWCMDFWVRVLSVTPKLAEWKCKVGSWLGLAPWWLTACISTYDSCVVFHLIYDLF